jgi:hypothetical protein
MKNLVTTDDIKRINRICSEYKIENYKINSDGSIDVNGHVDIKSKNLITIPLKFNKVYGNFNCHGNKLTSLEGCPNEVGGNFFIHSNQLKTLEHCPTIVGGHFDCSKNKLHTLLGCLEMVGGAFNCSDNKLKSLKYCPIKVNGVGLYCMSNSLTSLEYCPTEIDVLNCGNNKITSLEYCSTTLTNLYWYYNPLPDELIHHLNRLSIEHISIFLKYQSYYDVWTPELNVDSMNGLVDEIKDGLR